MVKIIVTVLICAAVAAAYPYNNLEYDVLVDDNGDSYFVIPVDEVDQHDRVRRQTTGSVGSNGVGIAHTGTILNNDKHRLDGTAFANKQHHGPLTTGGNLDYNHKPSGSGLSLGASNTRGFGTDVGAKGNYNFLNKNQGRTTAGVSGEYSRHYGGPGGTGRPNYGAFVNFKHNF